MTQTQREQQSQQTTQNQIQLQEKFELANYAANCAVIAGLPGTNENNRKILQTEMNKVTEALVNDIQQYGFQPPHQQGRSQQQQGMRA